MKKCLLFHNWRDWSKSFTGIRHFEGRWGEMKSELITLQKRECLRCHKIETRIVCYGEIPEND